MTLTRFLTLLRRTSRRLWVRVAGFALLAVLSVAIASALSWLVPNTLTEPLGPDALMPVLTILASSMLAVSTFSLNVMVSAHRAAAAQATPRVHRLLLEDTTTQNALGVFIGAFVYSLTAIILFRTHFSRPEAAVIVMGVTVVVVTLVILAMLRWIDHLSRLGSVDHALDVTEHRTAAVLRRHANRPDLGANPMTPDTILPGSVTSLPAPKSGFIQVIDMGALDDCTRRAGVNIYIARGPGQVVLQGREMAQISGSPSDDLLHQIANCFLIGDMRSFEQDAEFGLTVLSEISSRAMSPGVNDPGTAIEAISRMERLLWDWAYRLPDAEPPCYPHIFLHGATADDLVTAAFAATARDGAGTYEVAKHLMDALQALRLCENDPLTQAAETMQARLLDHAEKALPLSQDFGQLKRASHAG